MCTWCVGPTELFLLHCLRCLTRAHIALTTSRCIASPGILCNTCNRWARALSRTRLCIGNAHPAAPAARNLGNYHRVGEIVPFVNRACEWGVAIATFLSVLSTVLCHCARLTYFLHPKVRKMNAVPITPRLISLTLRRLQRAGSIPVVFKATGNQSIGQGTPTSRTQTRTRAPARARERETAAREGVSSTQDQTSTYDEDLILIPTEMCTHLRLPCFVALLSC